jgi:Uma2 family endonuclease
MRALMLEVPEHLLQERSRLGHDRRDEMWEGVLHMVPQPLSHHQRLGALLLQALMPAADAKGLWAAYETSLFRPSLGASDYRVPDVVVARPEHVSERGVEGRAELVVEILSPGDESREKLPFYADVGCEEVLLVDRETLVLELHVRGEARPPGDGPVALESLGVSIERIEGPALVATWVDVRSEIRPR